ncbi:MAG TPA: ABC transporter permease [Puia sp.]|jgi:putative ABC transport system permease protein|nr:ABC transporter permease [Puia sp.]
MFKNYFITAIRNLQRNKIYSGINVLGLSFGLATAMLIILYVKDELSYDRFNEKKDQIYRITAQMLDEKGHEVFKSGKTSMVPGPAFKQDIPEINECVRISNDEYVIKVGDKIFNQPIIFADDNFFSVFSFPLINGDPKKVLTNLNSMVVSDEIAKKYFGTTEVIGKTMELKISQKFEPFIISGVAKRSPQNSSIKFDVMLPMKFQEKIDPDDHWLNFFISSFVVLNPKADPSVVLNKMTRVYNERAKDQLKEAREKGDFKGSLTWGLQPLLQIHLSKDYDAEDELTDASNPTYSYILTGIAIFILVIACINFINLTIARSLKRSKEIGIRKVLGGQRVQLARQFLGESFMVCFISFVFALVLATVALPVFNELANKRLSLSYLADMQLIIGFIGLFLITGFAAGFYPALVLSGFNPIQTLYNRIKLSGKNYLAKGLVVLQFTLAALLIISTFFIYEQFHYLMNQKLGYNDKDLVVVNLDRSASKQLTDLFKTELLKNSSIKIVGAHNRGRQGTVAKVDGKEIQFDYDQIDDQYFSALQIPVIKGRGFSSDFPSDSTHSILVNETFVHEAGWKDPIGKTVDLFWRNRKLTVIGVVKDYHFRSLKEKIGSQLFTSEPEGNSSQLNIKISSADIPKTIQFIEATYKKLAPFYPFNYEFKNDINTREYEAEEKWKQIITFSAALTIFISCIGLLGLTMLSAEQRVKEIGIRKVLGASVSSIVQLISGNFLKLVLLANIIALPIAWWAVNQWLQNFAYHIDIYWWLFAIAVLITLSIAFATVGVQAIKAAMTNPVKSLRTE